MDITTGIKNRYWLSPIYALELANEALFCLLLYRGRKAFGKQRCPHIRGQRVLEPRHCDAGAAKWTWYVRRRLTRVRYRYLVYPLTA